MITRFDNDGDGQTHITGTRPGSIDAYAVKAEAEDRDPVNGIAAVIRRYPNDTAPTIVAAAIERHLNPGGPDCPHCVGIVADIIRKVNPDKQMGAGALAEAIWNELDGEN